MRSVTKYVLGLFSILLYTLPLIPSGMAKTTLPSPEEKPPLFSSPAFDKPTPPKEPAIITNDPRQVLARVNDDPITAAEVERLVSSLPKEMRDLPKDILYPQLIKQIALNRAIMLEIKKENIDKQPNVQQDIKAATQALVKDKLVNAYFAEKLKPALSQQAIQAYYNAHYAHQPIVKEVHLRSIIVQTKEIGDIIIDKIDHGHSFTSLVSIYSMDFYNRNKNHGDIGWFSANELTPPIAQAVFNLADQQHTPPLQTDYGWVISQKIGERDRTPPALATVEKEIKEQITAETINHLYDESLKKVQFIEY